MRRHTRSTATNIPNILKTIAILTAVQIGLEVSATQAKSGWTGADATVSLDVANAVNVGA
jgi:hypothetical protein